MGIPYNNDVEGITVGNGGIKIAAVECVFSATKIS
jgi:hypothetical protein